MISRKASSTENISISDVIPLTGLFQAHAGLDAIGAGLVGAGNDAGALVAVGNGQRAPAPFRVVTLFDGGKKGIHIDQYDGAWPYDGAVIACRVGVGHIL